VSGGAPFRPEQAARFDEALSRARANLTEEAEAAPLGKLAEMKNDVVAGASEARVQAVAEIRRLMTINYEVMTATDREARLLSRAGAWFAVFVTSFALLLSVVSIRRLTHRLIRPMQELWTTVEATRAGDLFRRCVVSDAPVEIRRIVSRVNEMLDMRANPRPWSDRHAKADHAVVLWTLRKYPEPAFIVDEGGQIFAANAPGHALLGQPAGHLVREALARDKGRLDAQTLPSGFRLSAEEIPGGEVRICRIHDVTAANAAPREA
jgi:nitrogen fixation/metabolism regulation signal transduction histidine kinase